MNYALILNIWQITHLEESTLDYLSLQKTDLRGANLTGADLRGTNFQGRVNRG